jgi:hypothetical protein
MKTKSKKNRKNNLNLQHNKYVMYILLVSAVINLLMYLQKNYLGSILLFFAVGLITSLYTKNMNIILFSTIIITNLTVFVGKMFGYTEGLGPLTNKNDKPIKCKGGDGKTTNLKMVNQPLFAITKKKNDDDDDDEGFIGFRGGAESLDSLTEKAFKEGYAGKKEGNTTGRKNRANTTGGNTTGGNTTGRMNRANTTGGNNGSGNNGGEQDDDDDDDEEQFKNIKEDIAESEALTKSLRKNNISKDTEKEIKKMLKGTDLKNLDTNELIQQQKGLMDAMKNMDPLIKNVNDMITNLKNSPISSFMGLGK